MAKKKAGRQQKNTTDTQVKKEHVHIHTTDATTAESMQINTGYNYTFSPITKKSLAKPTEIHETYTYIRHDLFKTIFVTTSIIGVQILLFYFLNPFYQ